MHSHTQSYLRDWIYGGIDGTVTTFAVISGVVGGKLAPLVILILGFANLLADGFSMAASNYLGTKSERDLYDRLMVLEKKRIQSTPVNAKAELTEMLQSKGLKGNALEQVIEAITTNKTLWVDTMLYKDYGLTTSARSPLKAALYTFFAFVFFGLIPLLPYVFSLTHTFFFSCVITAIVFFVIGSIKSFWSIRSWIYSGLETLLIGAVTASLAYAIGFILHNYLMNP